MVVLHILSKYVHFIGLKHPFNTFTVAWVFLREIVHLHELLASIASDRDRIFLSTFSKKLFKLHETELKKSTSYHPQTDRQTEIINEGL